jgi:hypothetical protein
MKMAFATETDIESQVPLMPANLPEVRFRQVHLDFHTSPLIPDVGTAFHPDEFADTLKKAHVNSINMFAKCHWGMSYYPTKVGVMHPSLHFDLLGEMIDACHKRDIHAIIYLCGMWDMRVANLQPGFRVLDEKGECPRGGPFKADWIDLCLNTPYTDYLVAQTAELAKNYDAEGFWLDLVDYPQDGCCCPYCMRERENLGLDSSLVEVRQQHTVTVMLRTMERLTETVRRYRPNALIFYNGKVRVGMRKDVMYETHIEIESLPGGGNWGYSHFSVMSRYVRNLRADYVGMTGRFHRSWGGFGTVRNQAALDYECFRVLAQAGKCSIGDQMHPRGKLCAAVYDVIGRSYESVEEKEPWCRAARAVAEIGYVSTSHVTYANSVTNPDLGLTNMLSQLHHQFDALDWDSDFTPYKVLILPDQHRLSADHLAKVQSYLSGGGHLILSHESGMDPDGHDFVLEQVGVRFVRRSPYPGDQGDYMESLGTFAEGQPAMPNFTFGSGIWVEPLTGTKVLARFWKPYFDRTYEHWCSHAQNPEDTATEYPAVTECGNVIYLAFPVFTAYALNSYAPQKWAVANCISRFLPNPLVRVEAPSTAEVTVTEQPGRRIVHILYYSPERRTPDLDIVEDVVPLHNVKLGLRANSRPSSVYLAPQETNLNVDYVHGYAEITIPAVNGHQMVVFES